MLNLVLMHQGRYPPHVVPGHQSCDLFPCVVESCDLWPNVCVRPQAARDVGPVGGPAESSGPLPAGAAGEPGGQGELALHR